MQGIEIGEEVPADLVSQDVQTAQQPLDPDTTSVEVSVPLGELLVRQGLVRQEQVDLAIELQASEAKRGVFLRLGELLVAMGVLDGSRIAEVLRLQGREIMVCDNCKTQYNVLGPAPEGGFHCRRCNRPLQPMREVTTLSVEETLVSDARSLEEGREFGEYVILGQISSGGMGTIYKARQKSLDRVVAMKVVDEEDPESPQFLREARAVARLRHPYIVAIHEVGCLNGVNYFTMDYIEGLPLNRAAPVEGLGVREVVEVFVKLCDAVGYAHDEGILHRDLKPSNVLLDRKHNPVLVDFGISREADAEESRLDQIVGSPAYLPPEYLNGGTYGIPGEVYALGATLYTVLSGRQPHSGIDTVQVLRKAMSEEPRPIRALCRAVDRELETVIMTALTRAPESRYSNARAFGDDLRRWLAGEEVTGRASVLFRLWRRIRARVAAALGLARE